MAEGKSPGGSPIKTDAPLGAGADAPRSLPGSDVANDAPGAPNGDVKASSRQAGEHGDAESGAAAGGQGEKTERQVGDASTASSTHRQGDEEAEAHAAGEKEEKEAQAGIKSLSLVAKDGARQADGKTGADDKSFAGGDAPSSLEKGEGGSEECPARAEGDAAPARKEAPAAVDAERGGDETVGPRPRQHAPGRGWHESGIEAAADEREEAAARRDGWGQALGPAGWGQQGLEAEGAHAPAAGHALSQAERRGDAVVRRGRGGDCDDDEREGKVRE
ncbi:hypothetical protein T484DRAFT_1886747, partial [Baffinella frigidus]